MNSASELESTVQREILLVSKASEVERAAMRLEIVKTCGEMEAAIRSCMISNMQSLDAQMKAAAEAVSAWQSIQPTLPPPTPPPEETNKTGRWRAGRRLDSENGSHIADREKGSSGRDILELESAIRREIVSSTRLLDAKINKLTEEVAALAANSIFSSAEASVGVENWAEKPSRGLHSNSEKYSDPTRGDTVQHSMEVSGIIQEVIRKLDALDKKVESVASAVGVRSGIAAGDDEEDRRRLKEKLKEALDRDRDRRNRVDDDSSEQSVWLEYIFGICRPDQRMGKRGSR